MNYQVRLELSHEELMDLVGAVTVATFDTNPEFADKARRALDSIYKRMTTVSLVGI